MSKNLSKEDLALWLAIIEKIKPLKQDKKLPSDPLPRKKITVTKQHPTQPIDSKHTINEPLQALTRQQYRKYTIDACLDLHGYTQEKAYDALLKFIDRNFEQGTRALLIITGKGVNQQGILKQQLPCWLANDVLKSKILSIAPARPEHGGQGAMYVLLRKR